MSSISVTEQRTGLSTFFAGVDGIETVYQRWPRALQNDNLPALIIQLGPAQYIKSGQGYGGEELIVRRQWMATIFVQNVTKGDEFAAEEAAEAFLHVVPDALAAKKRIKTSVTDGYRMFDVDIDGGSDEGVRMMQYNDLNYAGIEVSFFTITEEPITPTSA